MAPERNSEPLRAPTSAEYQHLLDENDLLRLELVRRDQIIANKDKTIDHLQLADRAKTKRMKLGVANQDLETGVRNLKWPPMPVKCFGTRRHKRK